MKYLVKPLVMAVTILFATPVTYAGSTEEGHGCTTVRPYVQSKGRCWHSWKEDGDRPEHEDRDVHDKSKKDDPYKDLTSEEKKTAKADDCKVAKTELAERKRLLIEEAEFEKACKEDDHGKSRSDCVKDHRDDDDKKKHEDSDKKFDNDKKTHDADKTKHDDDLKKHEEVSTHESDKKKSAEDSCKSESDGDKKTKCIDKKKKELDDADSGDEKKKKSDDDSSFEKSKTEFDTKDKEFKDEEDKHSKELERRESEKKVKDDHYKKHEEACKDEHDDDRHGKCMSRERSDELKRLSEDVLMSCAAATRKPVDMGLTPGSSSSGGGSSSSGVTAPAKSRETRQINPR